MRGLIDRKGEMFAYLEGKNLYTLDGELTGSIDGNFIVDLRGARVWRVVGDGVYSLHGMIPVGYFGGEKPSNYGF